ncbi:hypothetical protein BC332_14631 [Capsicum chinense]|nr:hypothetical protein BC332_14631 [Capsicum chinense]
MKYRIKNVSAHSLHFGSYCNRVFGSDIKNCAAEEAYNLFRQTIFGSFLDMSQCNFQGLIPKCILMLELEQGDPDEIHVYLQGTILKFTISEFALISGLKCNGNIEEHLYTRSSKSVAKYFSSSKHTVKKCIFVQRFKEENFDNNTDALNMSILYFIHTFLFSQVRDATISRSDFVMVEDGSTIAKRVDNVIPRIFNWKVVRIKVRYEKFMADRSGKRPAVDIHTQSDMDHQGFEDFSTIPPPKILIKADSEKTPSSVSGKSMPIDQLRTSDLERVDAPTLTPSSSGKSGHQDSSDQKWNKLKFFLKSYVDQKFTFIHKVMVKQHEESNDKRNKQYVELMSMLKHIKHTHEKDFEGFSSDVRTSTLNAFVEETVNQESEDIGTATSNALVDAVVNQNPDYSKAETPMTENNHEDHSDEYLSTISESAQLEIDAIIQGLAAPVDDIPLEVVKPVDETVNLHSPSDSQIPSNYPDSVVADYVESVVMADNENAVNNIIKGFLILVGLPWNLVDKVYVPINCNQNFHWVLAVIALKDRRIRVYNSLSNLRNMDSSPKIHKLAVMLPTFLSDSEFFEQTSRTDWPNLDAYRDKMSDTTQLLNTNPFEVEYVQNITQQDCDSLNYGLQKAKKDYVSENEDPSRPRPIKHSITDEMAIVRIG